MAIRHLPGMGNAQLKNGLTVLSNTVMEETLIQKFPSIDIINAIEPRRKKSLKP